MDGRRKIKRSESRDQKRKSINVIDVYDIASEIGKEFEELIDSHGAEHITSLMQKVISALEHLENLVQKTDSEQTVIEDLKKNIEHLEHEDTKKIEERKKYVSDIEQIEDHYKQETKDYVTTIERLQHENRKLSNSLTAATERDSAFSDDDSYIEIDLVNKLQCIVEKQREQIRCLNLSANDAQSELDELQGQNEKITNTARDLRRKYRQSQSQLHCLVDERAELQVTLQDQQRDTAVLAKRLGIAAKENEDLARSSTTTQDLQGKVVFDADDPKRPRFTLEELKDILQERNTLKARVSDLEDELELFRPKPVCSVVSPRLRIQDSSDIESCSCDFHQKTEYADEFREPSLARDAWQESDDSDDEDLPVQGPLPYEPEDAPWKRHETSGIRKFFRRVFGSQSDVESSLLSSPASSSSPRNLRKSFSKLNFLL